MLKFCIAMKKSAEGENQGEVGREASLGTKSTIKTLHVAGGIDNLER